MPSAHAKRTKIDMKYCFCVFFARYSSCCCCVRWHSSRCKYGRINASKSEKEKHRLMSLLPSLVGLVTLIQYHNFNAVIL